MRSPSYQAKRQELLAKVHKEVTAEAIRTKAEQSKMAQQAAEKASAIAKKMT